MGAIIGFCCFIAIVLIISYIAIRTSRSEYPNEKPDQDHYAEDHKDDRVNETYRAAGKSLKLNMMQMEAFRLMEEEAKRHIK